MKTILIAALALSLPATARAAEAPVTSKTPAQTISALVRSAAPKGWKLVSYSNSESADPVVRYEKHSDSIIVRIFGAPGSAYSSPAEFLTGPAASSLGEAPKEDGSITTAGGKLKAYRRRYPMVYSDPHGHAAPALYGTEVFAIMPLKSPRFAVLSWQRASPAPDLKQVGEKAWAAFLKSVRPVIAAKRVKKQKSRPAD